MKKISYILVSLILGSFLMVSCDAMLDVDSERYTFEENYRIGSDHDSLYSMVGILSQLQKLGDRYVLLGELRGELMGANDDASMFIKQINDFNVTSDNPYASVKEYYAVINSCNYTIHYADTTMRKRGDMPMHRLMAAAKSIRAWTYMQLVLNHGKAKYIVEPILTAKDAEKDYEEYDINQLADALIADLLPFRKTGSMNLGAFESFNSRLAMFPVRLILGDLYLWKGDYENAAKMYHELIFNNELLIWEPYSSYWTFENNVVTDGYFYWNYLLYPTSIETVAALASSPDYGYAFSLDSLSYHGTIFPTEISLKNWAKQVYYNSESAIEEGDMRAFDSHSGDYNNSLVLNNLKEVPYTIITKFIDMNSDTEKRIILYRNSLIYLRYAEAVNRLGYPNLAFEVMKAGLSPQIVRSGNVGRELRSMHGSAIPEHLDFSNFKFTDNVGTRMRGLGKSNLDSTYFYIHSLPTKDDSILFVEDKIVEELSLELAYEGNRYQDLVRIAKRRNDPAYLADKVSAKYTTNKEIIRAKLMDPKNWILP